jgi:DNA-binding response OmpR family regulator
MKILLVDDDPDIISAVSVVLENQKHTVISANNKKDGLELAKNENPDLMILDVMMEAMADGFDLAKDLRKVSYLAKTPIIMMTSIDTQTGVNFKSAFGNTDMLPVDGYLEKPVAPHELIAEIERLAAKK